MNPNSVNHSSKKFTEAILNASLDAGEKAFSSMFNVAKSILKDGENERQPTYLEYLLTGKKPHFFY